MTTIIVRLAVVVVKVVKASAEAARVAAAKLRLYRASRDARPR